MYNRLPRDGKSRAEGPARVIGSLVRRWAARVCPTIFDNLAVAQTPNPGVNGGMPPGGGEAVGIQTELARPSTLPIRRSGIQTNLKLGTDGNSEIINGRCAERKLQGYGPLHF
jgi:hypothetical protein